MTGIIGITAAQLRAARALVGWSQADLARAAHVGRQTVARLELGEQTPLMTTLNALVAALTIAGVRFVDDGERGVDGEPEGRGVRWRRPGDEGPDIQGAEMFKTIVDGLRDFDPKR
jgi:transcriptional regulator with XRE-family HTH domain